MNKLATAALIGASMIGAPLSATALSFAPADTYFALKGTLTLFPVGETPIRCKVKMKAFTGSGTTLRELPKILSIKPTSNLSPCSQIEFLSLPWLMEPINTTTGGFGGGGFFIPGGSDACNGGPVEFTENASGVWSI